MTEHRKYSLDEIEQMRADLRYIEIIPGMTYYENEMSAKIEDMIRTYVAAGIDPADIRNRRNEAIAAYQQRY